MVHHDSYTFTVVYVSVEAAVAQAMDLDPANVGSTPADTHMSALEALCDYALYKSTFTFALHMSHWWQQEGYPAKIASCTSKSPTCLGRHVRALDEGVSNVELGCLHVC